MDRVALGAACDRLENTFGPRAIAAGASGVGTWANSTSLGFEVRFGKQRGGMWQAYVKYARRRRRVFGQAVPYRSIEAAEEELRIEIEEFLSLMEAGNPPPHRGVWLGFGGS
jgi:hypothetical protein